MAKQFDLDPGLVFSGFFLLMGALALISLLRSAKEPNVDVR